MEVTAIISENKIRNIAIEEAIVQTDRIQGQVHQLNQRIIDMERIIQKQNSEIRELNRIIIELRKIIEKNNLELKELKRGKELNANKRSDRLGNRK